MNRKLMVLNVLLVAAVTFAGVQFRRQWKAAHDREAGLPRGPLKKLPTVPYSPILPEPPVLPMTYAGVAQNMLFDRSRDSKVVEEPPPPAPPPKPMPPLPAYHGMMNIGESGPIAFLSIGNAGHQAIHPGEPIGEFKLVDVTGEDVVFEWNGQQVKQLLTRPAGEAAQAVDSRPDLSAKPAAPPPEIKGLGVDIDAGHRRTCNINDGNPPGTVLDGYRKVIYTTPFGQSCGWEK